MDSDGLGSDVPAPVDAGKEANFRFAALRSHVAPFLLPTVHENAERTVVWDVQVVMDPESEGTLHFDFGDGTSESLPIPKGDTVHSLRVVHEFPEDTASIPVNEAGFVVQNLSVEGMHPGQGFVQFAGRARQNVNPISGALEQRLRKEGIELQPGLADYMQQSGGACHLIIRGAKDEQAASVALSLFGSDLSEIPHPDEPSEGLPNFVSDVRASVEGPELWFDVKDNFEVFPELVGRVVELLGKRLVEADVQPATIGWPAKN